MSDQAQQLLPSPKPSVGRIVLVGFSADGSLPSEPGRVADVEFPAIVTALGVSDGSTHVSVFVDGSDVVKTMSNVPFGGNDTARIGSWRWPPRV